MTVTSLPHYAAARNDQTYTPAWMNETPERRAAAVARTEVLNDACRELVAMIGTPALLTGTGGELIQKLRELFNAEHDPTDDELIGMAVMRVSYLER